MLPAAVRAGSIRGCADAARSPRGSVRGAVQPDERAVVPRVPLGHHRALRGRTFRRRQGLPPVRCRGAQLPAPFAEHDYNRAITGTFYRPLQVRGHVAQGLWLEVPRHAGPTLLPEQFDELYRATLDFVKPVSLTAGVLGILS